MEGLYQRLRRALREETPCLLVTRLEGGEKLLLLEGGERLGSLGEPGLESWVEGPAWEALAARRDRLLEAPDGERLFVEAFPPPEQLLIFGAVHTAIPLTALARVLGFRVVVVDPRAKFANRERFPEADDLVVAWPQEALTQLRLDRFTYACILSHDPKIDHPTLEALLRSPVAYIGAIGSRQTQRQRREWLRQRGFTEEDLARLHGPVGLPLGGDSPEEIALSILAEIQSLRAG